MTKHRNPSQSSPNHRPSERDAPPAASDISGAEALPERWSAARKAEIAIPLLKGESLDALSRAIQQPASRISEWRDRFLDGGEPAMKERTDDPEVEAHIDEKRRLQAKIGQLAMEHELLYARCKSWASAPECGHRSSTTCAATCPGPSERRRGGRHRRAHPQAMPGIGVAPSTPTNFWSRPW